MATYHPLSFDKLNEADVREEVIARILSELGYRSGTEFDIIREQSLMYPRSFLGTKNPAKDPDLRGKADYILDIQRRIRWVIEAKAPGIDIAADDIEQAWTYANHPEVRAVYFVLCNGRTFQIFQTHHGPQMGPILHVAYEELGARFDAIANIVGPVAIERDFPDRSDDTQPPIGPGLRSVVRIASGVIRYDSNSFANPIINQLQVTITDGAMERDENGQLVTFLRTHAPIRSFQELNERLGFHRFEMVSPDRQLSIDATKPTTFRYSGQLIFPEGTQLLDVQSWQMVELPIAITVETTAVASGALVGNTFTGRFVSMMQVRGGRDIKAELGGDFYVRLA